MQTHYTRELLSPTPRGRALWNWICSRTAVQRSCVAAGSRSLRGGGAADLTRFEQLLRVAAMTRQLDIDLARHPFLFGMSRQDVGLLADCAVRVHFAEGEIVFREGEEADRVHLIESGNVSLRPASAMSAVVFETVGPGELLGSSWLLPPHKWHVTAQASGPVTAIVLKWRTPAQILGAGSLPWVPVVQAHQRSDDAAFGVRAPAAAPIGPERGRAASDDSVCSCG